MKKQFRSFEDAREFVQSLGLKGQKDWLEYCKSGNKPSDIPAHPWAVYKNKGWTNGGDFLGTGRTRNFRDFKDAREFVQSLGLKGQKDWLEYCKSGRKQNDIPSSPDSTYKNKGWTNWGDFVGTGRTRNFRDFKDAREFVQSLGMKGAKEWEEYCKSGRKQNDIPSSPNSTYKNKGWTNWGDFLGTGVIQTQKRHYKNFDDVKKYVHSLNLKNREEWITWNKSNQISNDIPIAPQKVYKKKWEGWGNFLGTGVIQTQKRQYKSFEDAKNFTRNLNLKNISEWREYAHSNKRPKDIPSLPHKTYKNKGWISVGDWLGTNSIASFNRKYRSFNDARKFIQSLKLKNYEEWNKYSKSGKKPEDIPSAPWTVYKEWKNEKKI